MYEKLPEYINRYIWSPPEVVATLVALYGICFVLETIISYKESRLGPLNFYENLIRYIGKTVGGIVGLATAKNLASSAMLFKVWLPELVISVLIGYLGTQIFKNLATLNVLPAKIYKAVDSRVNSKLDKLNNDSQQEQPGQPEAEPEPVHEGVTKG